MLQIADDTVTLSTVVSSVYLKEPNIELHAPIVYLHCLKSLLKWPQFAICNINNSESIQYSELAIISHVTAAASTATARRENTSA